MTAITIPGTEPVGPDGADLLVLGPSLGTSSMVWQRCIPMLAERFRVVAWDLPGHGVAEPVREPFEVADLADAVVQLADRLGADTFWYAGVSIGGATGLELGLRHPQRVRALGIVASGARIGSPEVWMQRAAQARSQSTSSLIVGSAQRWFAPETAGGDPDLTGRLLHVLQDADDESYARCCEALAVYDVTARLPEMDARVLALWGEHDVATPEADSVLIGERVPGARVERIDGAAHLPPVDRPDETARALLAFFTDVEEDAR